ARQVAGPLPGLRRIPQRVGMGSEAIRLLERRCRACKVTELERFLSALEVASGCVGCPGWLRTACRCNHGCRCEYGKRSEQAAARRRCSARHLLTLASCGAVRWASRARHVLRYKRDNGTGGSAGAVPPRAPHVIRST